MVKSKSSQVAVQEHPLRQVSALDFEGVKPAVIISSLAYELQSLASNIDGLADISAEMSVSSDSASLRFRAYSRRPGL